MCPDRCEPSALLNRVLTYTASGHGIPDKLIRIVLLIRSVTAAAGRWGCLKRLAVPVLRICVLGHDERAANVKRRLELDSDSQGGQRIPHPRDQVLGL